MLYRTSRELLDLFRAIVPTLHATEVASIPRTAAVLHNDCVYLAHESMLLGEHIALLIPSHVADMHCTLTLLRQITFTNRSRVQNQVRDQ